MTGSKKDSRTATSGVTTRPQHGPDGDEGMPSPVLGLTLGGGRCAGLRISGYCAPSSGRRCARTSSAARLRHDDCGRVRIGCVTTRTEGILMAENVKSHRRSDVPDEVLALLHTARRIGYGLLVGAIIIEVLSFQFAHRECLHENSARSCSTRSCRTPRRCSTSHSCCWERVTSGSEAEPVEDPPPSTSPAESASPKL